MFQLQKLNSQKFSNFRLVAGKEQLIIAAMAKALEIIPRQLCDNAGFDATNILNKLRQKHAQVGFLKVESCYLKSYFGLSCLCLVLVNRFFIRVFRVSVGTVSTS